MDLYLNAKRITVYNKINDIEMTNGYFSLYN